MSLDKRSTRAWACFASPDFGDGEVSRGAAGVHCQHGAGDAGGTVAQQELHRFRDVADRRQLAQCAAARLQRSSRKRP
jgi:hypothetical protein